MSPFVGGAHGRDTRQREEMEMAGGQWWACLKAGGSSSEPRQGVGNAGDRQHMAPWSTGLNLKQVSQRTWVSRAWTVSNLAGCLG